VLLPLLLRLIAAAAAAAAAAAMVVAASDAWDLDKRTLSEELQRLVLTYGELAQATYDNVGTDPCDATFGYCVKQPGELLTYLTDQTPLAPNAPEPTPKLVGTGDRCVLKQSWL
jgi:hypothetical protein